MNKTASETLKRQKEMYKKNIEIREARGGKTTDELIKNSSKKGAELDRNE